MTSQVIVIVIELCNLKKDIERLRTNDIIQHNNSMLILWQIYILESRIR